jgi:hypothetical protein
LCHSLVLYHFNGLFKETAENNGISILAIKESVLQPWKCGQKDLSVHLKKHDYMALQSSAKMFLSDERGCIETDWYRCYHTFNNGTFFSEHKQPVDEMFLFADETLAPRHSIQLEIEEGVAVYLLPIVGAFLIKGLLGAETSVEPGQLFMAANGMGSIEILNPYYSELINFIQIKVGACNRSPSTITAFDIDKNKNHLVKISSVAGAATASQPIISIAKFDGRKDGNYTPHSSNNSLFIFVVQGVFEVQGRLLHARDGLAIWHEQKGIELEALSNEAIVLIIEQNKEPKLLSRTS